jgi:hypothetical protein
MKKRIISILAIAALLVASIAVPCVAATQEDIPASVTVSEYISITISDTEPEGINFGTLNPGTTDNIEENSGEFTPSLSITVEPDSNANVNLLISGTDFDDDGGHTFAITNAKYSTTHAGTPIPMSDTDTLIVDAENLAPNTTVELWHWLDVPGGITSGDYGSMFSYSAEVYTGS